MTRQLQRVAGVMLLLFGALFININYVQVLRADDLASDNRNTRTIIEEYKTQRGSMIVAGQEIALSRDTGGEYRFERAYPRGQRYAHLTGFYSVVYGRSELEDAANEFLSGAAAEAFVRNVGSFLTGEERKGDDIVLTINPKAQRAAAEALGDREGAVVAMEPKTGRVLAIVSSPTYDPNKLSTFDREAAVAYWQTSENARRNRALRETYPPGSTFKLVTAAAALEAGVKPDDTFPDDETYTPPQTSRGIPNFGGGLCNGGSDITLAEAMEVSCNTVFARLGNQLGPESLVAQAEAFGFNTDWEFQMSFASSGIPAELDAPSTAQSAIGQRDVRTTPLQVAMVSAAIANGGTMMRPYVIDRVEDFSGEVLREFQPAPQAFGDAGRAVSPQTAAALTDMMVRVVDSGSGTNAAISGVEVAGKTGTAQVGEGRNPTVWFTGFAPVNDPQVAVAVVIPDGGGVGSEATGGAVAAPVAREVLQAVLD